MFLLIALISCLCLDSVHGAANCGPSETANCELRCQNTTLATGAPTAIATACADTRADCNVLFNCTTDTAACDDPAAYTTFNVSDPATYPKYRAALCDLPSMQDIALECAKTCMICCETSEYNCADDDSGVVDCAANAGKCKDANWTDIMSSYCPQTCGLCMNGTCSDLNSGCNGLASLCKNVDWVSYMQTNCARTCDTCTTGGSNSTGGSCTNVASNCAENANLCTNSVYQSLMAQQCCATCAGAGSGGGSSCTDSSTSCSSWVSNGFCTSTFYTAAQKREYCGRSCNVC